MIVENVRKQLADYRKRGKKLKYLINYLMGLVDDEDDLVFLHLFLIRIFNRA